MKNIDKYMIGFLIGAFVMTFFVIICENVCIPESSQSIGYGSTDIVLVEPTYNKEKDAFINNQLDSMYGITYTTSVGENTMYEILCPDLKITAVYYKAIEFEQSERWVFLAANKNGESIIIIENASLWENKLKPETYQRIKNITKN